MISEFYPCALSQDEYLSIACTGDTYFCMRNWSISDGEGAIRFVLDQWLMPGMTFTLSFNSTSYRNAYNKLPDISLDQSSGKALVNVTGSFRLADAGDAVALISQDGTILDALKYGSEDELLEGWNGPAIPSLRKGEVAKRLEIGNEPVDTDSASDWMPFREYRYGYTEFVPMSFSVQPEAVTAFTSPDCSLEVLSGAISASKMSLCACAYEFSSVPITNDILQALDRGVQVRLLVDGAPAGDMSRDEVACLSVLRRAGAQVSIVNGNVSNDVVQHIGALHSKYIVIDSSMSVVMSENIVEDGLPQDRVFGNRGWGVVVTDHSLASYLLELFESDSRRNRPDVRDWLSDPRFNESAVLPEVLEIVHNQTLLPSLTTSERATVTVVASPDGSASSPYLLNHMNAVRTLRAEVFQADLYWKSRWNGQDYLNPLVERVLNSASRGADAKLLLDSSWFNLERNEPIVDFLISRSSVDSLDCCRLIDERSPVSLLHNKGAVIDGTVSAITSNNWVHASFARNRELALIVESEEVAQHFEQCFEYDWVSDESPPVCNAGDDLRLELGSDAVLDASASADDRQISDYSWDFDADGIVDSRHPQALFSSRVPGEHVVVLEVTDAWGNSATDEIRVVVSPASRPDDRRDAVASLSDLWPLPISLAAFVVVIRFLRRKRTGPVARNLNHRPRS